MLPGQNLTCVQSSILINNNNTKYPTIVISLKYYYAVMHRPFNYFTKEPGLNDIFILFYSKGSNEWLSSFYCQCVVLIQKFFKMYKNLVQFRFPF